MRRFGIQLLREAPSAPLRATANLAHAYQPLARELFSAAFACCWKELSESYRANLVQALKAAFVADVSPEISQALLNLAEFMEHDEGGGLPIEIDVLAELALKCRAYAKALYYKEREYATGKSSSCVEALIRINGKLDLPDAALGLLASCGAYDTPAHVDDGLDDSPYDQPKQHNDMYYSVMHNTGSAVPGADVQKIDFSVKSELWLAKLGAWTEALNLYETQLNNDPDDTSAVVGCMRCFAANAEWREVLDLADHHTLVSSEGSARADLQRKADRMCANAAWRLGQWGDLEKYAHQLVENETTLESSPIAVQASRDGIPIVDFDGAVYSAVLHIHEKSWAKAASAIDSARRAMDSRLAALMTESYGRAYRNMVSAQNIAEMEEIVDYLKLEDDISKSTMIHPANHPNLDQKRNKMLSVWKRRLAGCHEDAEVYDNILSIRSLVLRPEEAIDEKLHLSHLARQNERSKFGERVLLEPLEKMNADTNGECFGFGLPEQVALSCNWSGIKGKAGRTTIGRILDGDLTGIVPPYGEHHEELCNHLLQTAGSVER
jgi:serine/threonine-protein kinase mTOR